MKRTVLFLAPQLRGHFYSGYLVELIHQARNHAEGGLEIVISPYPPAGGMPPETQLTSILSTQLVRPAGIFMIPSAPDDHRLEIARFCKENPRVPLVTLDVHLDPSAPRPQDYPHFVGADEVAGGRAAALAAISELRELAQTRSKRHFRVLVLAGGSTPWERQRRNSFSSRLLEMAQAGNFTVTISVSHDLEYSYDNAHQYVRFYEMSTDESGNELAPPDQYDVIFGCNDDMALGAANAIEELLRMNLITQLPRIIGYDGTERMLNILRMGHSSLKNTISVKQEKQAEVAVVLMKQLIRGDRAGATSLIPPEPFRK